MIAWALQPLVLPAAEPVSLADAKNFCRVSADNTADDAEILRLIRAARSYVEAASARALVQSRFLLVLDRFPFPSNYDRALYSQDQFIPIGPTNMPFYDQFAIRLMRSPVVSVDAVQYVDSGGVLQTLDPAQYTLDLVTSQSAGQARLLPAFGVAWPIARYQANAVQVTFTAGSLFPVTVDASADTISPAAVAGSLAGGRPTLTDGMAVDFYASGAANAALAGGLAPATTYYTVSSAGTGAKVSLTPGGTAVDLTGAPTGTMLANLLAFPEVLRNALLLHVALHYELRGGTGSAELSAGIEQVNYLLDQERCWASEAGGGGGL